MRLRLLLRLFALFLASLALSGCRESWSWNEKLTVTVETLQGEKSASSVIRHILVHRNGWYELPQSRGAGSGYLGEAVVLEVMPGRYLFALLPGVRNPYWLFFPGADPVEVGRQFETLRDTRIVPPDQYPRLVTFDDIANPMSVRQVDPANLAASFGPGVRLKSMQLEITGEPVTRGSVERVLPQTFFSEWGRIHKEAVARGIDDNYFKSILRNISRSDFQRK
ncbi:hypothetical protein [Agrobacterium deltaense]|uniref:hypothetical protein n=1 Tax=Agrobacterium deltaense TaxID=1183412 RepID=UPI000F63B986|nr:hypothetical protein [Agrobacterium deltaense]RRN67242.1 hypothetical protein EIQ31_23240 [Agrobacterium deltaense]